MLNGGPELTKCFVRIIRYWSREKENSKKNRVEGMASNLDISNAFLLYLCEIKNNGWG